MGDDGVGEIYRYYYYSKSCIASNQITNPNNAPRLSLPNNSILIYEANYDLPRNNSEAGYGGEADGLKTWKKLL